MARVGSKFRYEVERYENLFGWLHTSTIKCIWPCLCPTPHDPHHHNSLSQHSHTLPTTLPHTTAASSFLPTSTSSTNQQISDTFATLAIRMDGDIRLVISTCTSGGMRVLLEVEGHNLDADDGHLRFSVVDRGGGVSSPQRRCARRQSPAQ